MARLHEYQAKAILAKHGIAVPRGTVVRSASEVGPAIDGAGAVGLPCVLKIQAWTTGRAAMGGVAIVERAADAAEHTRRMLGLRVGQFPVTEVLVEERLSIARELYVSFAIDERERRPVMLLSAAGGSGVEERGAAVNRIDCAVDSGPEPGTLRKAVAALGLDAALGPQVERVVNQVFTIARQYDARSVEINPLAITKDGRVVATDCRMTIDDYAVSRHPELGIEIARELDHPPTDLEKIAYAVEQADHRGTFFFAQMNTRAAESSKGLIGFHGAGGGGSMMSMDAITAEGFTIANFTDASGNPSPAKVYRAARIILAQPGLAGYFGSGSGVANQEQYWSAYGLAKAFWEMDLDIPAVIRLGGNTEDRAVEILHGACRGLRAKVEGYKKTDPPAKIAARFAALVAEHKATWKLRRSRRPGFVGAPASVQFELKGGRVWIDAAAWKKSSPAIIARANGALRDDAGKPALAVKPEDFAAKDSDMIACEIECRRDGIGGVFVELDIPGLDEYVSRAGESERGGRT